MSYRSSHHHNKHGNANRNKIMKEYQFQAPIMDTAPYCKYQEHYRPIYFHDPSLNYLQHDSQATAPRTAPRRLRVIEYEYEVPQPPPDRNENYDQQPADEDINKEAEDFIKLEHRKFLMSKTMPNKE